MADGEEKMLIVWQSEERPFKQRSRDYYGTVAVLGILVGVILFVVFVSAKRPPVVVEQKVTDRGVVISGERFTWEELVAYWVSRRWGRGVLHLLTQRRWPGQVVVVLPEEEKKAEEIEAAVKKQVVYQEPKEGWVDRIVGWVGKKIPLEG